MMDSLFGVLSGVLEPPAQERRTTLLAGQVVDYTLKRSGKRRTIGLSIDGEGLVVAMPLRASENWLNSVLQDKADWIVEKLAEWQAHQPVPVRWRDGESIHFMGEALTLRVVASLFVSPPLLRGRQLFVHVADSGETDAVEEAVTAWLREQAETLFHERVAVYSPQLGVMPSRLKLSSARTQWGSCNENGTVHLNWQLIKLPLRLVDYVVVHELAHLIEMNHSTAFWQVVRSVCPDYRRRRAELSRQGRAA